MKLSECTNTKYVAMDRYETFFILVGRNIINRSIMTDGRYEQHPDIRLTFPSPSTMSDDIHGIQNPIYHMRSVGHPFNLYAREPPDIR